MMDKPPAPRALAVAAQPAPAVPPVAPRRISAKVRAAIGYLVRGECKTLAEAAEKAKFTRENLSRALDKPHVAEYLRQQTLRRLGLAAARAGHTKVELLDSDSEIVRDRASTFVLGLAGIAPAAESSVNVNIAVKAGFVIDISEPTDRPGAPMRIVSPTFGPAPAVEHDADAE
jgi:hypothetical protein